MAAARETAGAASARVAENVRAWRVKRGMSTYDVARELGKIGWPIAPTGVLRIEQCERRVDVDDLLALAVVLGVNVNMLLWPSPVLVPSMPAECEPFSLVTDQVVSTPADVRDWIDGAKPLVLLLPDGSRPPVPASTITALFQLEAAPYKVIAGAISPGPGGRPAAEAT